MPEPANLLRHETSPYLLQHAGNPVHWRPWGEAALAEARATGKPILLSIGYAACHWCHVMAHESFEDATTAALMNRLYVPIKVDREERPDIDQVYMAALQALGEQGGWPLTMFLSPEGEPFWGGTYFPPEPRWGRPSFVQVLTGVAEAWTAGDEAIRHNAVALGRALVAMSGTKPGGAIGPAVLDRVGAALLGLVDREGGGLRGAPKFPNPPIFRFLWQEGQRTGRPEYGEAVRHLLERMSQGGIHDHLGGGYARYSTDAAWLAPHFEKMLYDNAQILELLAFAQAGALAQAGQPDPLFAERAAGTVGWMVRDMDAAGAFAASEDADSEGEEGRFYVWTEAEIDRRLGDSAAFKAAYDVTAAGNWEGRTILRRITARGDAVLEARLAADRAVLLQARDARPRPGRDDKVLADWNGLAVVALSRAAIVFDRPDWLARANATFDAVRARLDTTDGRVRHAWRSDRVSAAGLLDDQAAMARAALALFEAEGVPARLDQAIAYAQAALGHFADADGSFYTSADDAADVPAARPRSAADNATPSGNGQMAELFARLHHLTGQPCWRRHAEAAITAFSGAADGLAGMPTLLAAADLLEDAVTVVVTGPRDDPRAVALTQAALASPDPVTCVLRVVRTDELPRHHPAHGKAVDEGARAYVCRSGRCSLPVGDPADVAALMRRGPAWPAA